MSAQGSEGSGRDAAIDGRIGTDVGTRFGTVYGVLLNDVATVARLAPSFAAPPYHAAPRAPVLYIKPRNTVAADGAAVAVPSHPGVVRIDATVGAVIGLKATRVAARDALRHVAGYVVVSDVTLPHESYYRPAIRERCRDGFCPIGTASLPPGFALDAAEVTVAIDGAIVHRRSLHDVVRSLPRLLEDVTEFMTLDVGDLLLMGPPDAAPFAKPGSTVRIEVSGLVGLTHTLVAESGRP